MIIMAYRGDDIWFTGPLGMMYDGRFMRRLLWELVAHRQVPFASSGSGIGRRTLIHSVHPDTVTTDGTASHTHKAR